MKKLLLLLALLACGAKAQTTNPACPGATGALPHCVIINWTAPTTGSTPTGYNIYTGGNTAGQCATVSAATCTKLGSVTGTTFTWDTTATAQLVEGKTYFYVVTSTNGSGESGPSVEVSTVVPFLMPQPPTGVTVSGK